MALPSYTVVATALKALMAVALEDRTVQGSRQAFNALNDFAAAAQRVSKATYSNLQLPRELFAGLAGVNGLKQFANGADAVLADVAALVANMTLIPGESFVVGAATNDLTDNALATAKGSGVAAGDVFTTLTGTTVLYLGTDSALVN